jgi:hypothetical protein
VDTTAERLSDTVAVTLAECDAGLSTLDYTGAYELLAQALR